MRRKSVAALVSVAGLGLAVILAIAGSLLIWGSTYVHNTVHNQLAAQQVYFPPKGRLRPPPRPGPRSPRA